VKELVSKKSTVAFSSIAKLYPFNSHNLLAKATLDETASFDSKIHTVIPWYPEQSQQPGVGV